LFFNPPFAISEGTAFVNDIKVVYVIAILAVVFDVVPILVEIERGKNVVNPVAFIGNEIIKSSIHVAFYLKFTTTTATNKAAVKDVPNHSDKYDKCNHLFKF
jgi:hypothetical protein